jgi:hypothetical protein
LLLELPAATLSTKATQLKNQYMKRELNRSAITGKIVSKKFAEANPDTTVAETTIHPEQQYFSYIGQVYSLKNNLERAIYQALKKYDRQVIPKSQIKEFIKKIQLDVAEAHMENPRCKVIKVSFWQPGLGDKDYAMNPGGQICTFHIYASK